MQGKDKKLKSVYQNQSPHEHERLFFCLIIFAYIVSEAVSSTIDDFLDHKIEESTRNIIIIARFVYYTVFYIFVILYFTAKKKKQVIRTQIYETIIVLFLGGIVLIYYLIEIFNVRKDDYGTADEESQARIYIISSDSLLSFMLVILIVQRTYNVIVYLLLVISGHVVLLFDMHEISQAIFTIIEAILLLILFVYLQKKKMKNFLETWKLKTSDTFFRSLLSFLPESFMVITQSGDVSYRNDYLEKMFECELKTELEEFYANFSALSLRDCIEETKYKLLSSSFQNLDMDELSIQRLTNQKAFKEVFKAKAMETHSIKDLITFFKDNVELWEKVSSHTLVFDTRYTIPKSEKTLSIEVKAFIGQGDQGTFLTFIFRDTTDRDKIAMLESEKENYKNNVIASFSHELRTPLNSNMGSLEQCMNRPDIPAVVKETLLEPALTSAKLLLHVINDTLDYSQILNRSFKLNIRALSITQTIKQCIGLFEKRVLEKGIKLNIDINVPENSLFSTDHQRLSQILVNVLSNALKFTFTGSISVNFSKEFDGLYKLSVKDTGIGMEEEVQKKLRKNFGLRKSFESKVSSEAAGIGLGLIMASTFCHYLSSKLMPGLHFTSTKGEGTEFYFLLKNFSEEDSDQSTEHKCEENLKTVNMASPLVSEASEREPINTEITTYDSLKFKNKLTETTGTETSLPPMPKAIEHDDSVILIVDDEVFNILILENYCKNQSIKTERAFNGKDALEKLEKLRSEGQKIKLILMDVNMPILDGYGATKAIREMVKEQNLENLIIVGVTAYVSKEKIDKCYECGMDEVVHKPLSQGDFLELLKKYKLV